MKIQEIIQFLEARCPLTWQEGFDNSGLQCGDVQQSVTGVYVCFEVSDETIEAALQRGCNLVISHHPLLLGNGILKVAPIHRVGRIICKAIESKMVIYAMHTNMDSAPHGINALFASKLRLREVSVLSPQAEAPHVGLGRVGELETPMPAVDFLQQVKTLLSVPVIKYYGDDDKWVSRVALCGGGGSSFIALAMRAGADIYLSGDIKYHQFHEADGKMVIADLGHLESEHFVIEIIYNELKENFSNFAVHLSEREEMRIKTL